MSSLQRGLNSFFAKLENTDYSIMAVTKGAFSQARKHFKPSAFIELTHTSAKDFYANQPYTIWHDHRLLSVDSSRISLPYHEDTIKKYGQTGYGPGADSMQTQALTSILFDPLNMITLDGRIKSIHCSEIEMLQEHLSEDVFKPNDLL